ncbi:MAG TPA: serine protease [Kofleriaceae bacterium]
MTRAAILAVFACACARETGTTSSEESIIGGETASTSQFKTVVALEERAGDWFCTGTLVDEHWVITAAHCVEGETADDLQVRFDADNVDNATGTTVVTIAAIHADPDFADSWPHDIAVMELSDAVTDRDATPIHRGTVALGTTVTQVGYGGDSATGSGAGILRALDTPSVDCAQVGDASVTNTTDLCFDASDGTATCHGDSGGPALVAIGDGFEIAGITSGGTGSDCGDGWDLETAVAGELDFVDQYVPKSRGGGCDAGGGAAGCAPIVAFALRFRRRRR